MKLLLFIRDWTEVWALLIPLFIILFYRPRGRSINLLIIYVILAIILNTLCMAISHFYDNIPEFLYVNGMPNNNVLYNLHSITRVLFFSAYLLSVRQYRYPLLLRSLLVAYIAFVVLNFLLTDESPLNLATNIFAAESIVLLIMCLAYFFESIHDDSTTNWLKHPSFIICAGISLYEVLTFFIFLFFYPLNKLDEAFFVVAMRIYAIALLLLCILLAIGLYRSSRQASTAFEAGT